MSNKNNHHSYAGQCHCGAIDFTITGEVISCAFVCNCSICRRKGGLMSDQYFSPKQFQLLQGREDLTLYQFGDCDVNHYFCGTCGVYPFHEASAKPGFMRVNLRCIDSLDLDALSLKKIDGASF